MGNSVVARAFSGIAEMFWQLVPAEPPPGKDVVLRALDAIGKRFSGADADSGDDWHDPSSSLGRMVAIAFDATPDEIASEDGDAWFDGPLKRFRARYRLT